MNETGMARQNRSVSALRFRTGLRRRKKVPAEKSSVHPLGISPNGCNITLVVPAETHKRLGEKCFRGTQISKAGNFMRWNGFYDFMRSDVRHDLIEEIMERIKQYEESRTNKRRFRERVQIECEFAVGWASTERIDRLDPSILEPFSLNGRATGLRIRRNARIAAPQTFFMTIIYTIRFKSETDDWEAIVNSMYPGEDVGPLGPESGGKGSVNITEREEVAFFGFQHPGLVTSRLKERELILPPHEERRSTSRSRSRRDAA
jgi:hypothetical protein